MQSLYKGSFLSRASEILLNGCAQRIGRRTVPTPISHVLTGLKRRKRSELNLAQELFLKTDHENKINLLIQ